MRKDLINIHEGAVASLKSSSKLIKHKKKNKEVMNEKLYDNSKKELFNIMDNLKFEDSIFQKKSFRYLGSVRGLFNVIFIWILFVAQYSNAVSMTSVEAVEHSVAQTENHQENNGLNSGTELEKKFNTDDVTISNDKIEHSNNIIETTDQSSKTVYKEEKVVQTGDSQENTSSGYNIESEKELDANDATVNTDTIRPTNNTTDTTSESSKAVSGEENTQILILLGCALIYFIVCTIMVCNETAVVFVGWLDYIISLVCSIVIMIAIIVATDEGSYRIYNNTLQVDIDFLILAFFGVILLLPLYIRLSKFNTNIGALLLIPYKILSSILLPFIAFACITQILRGKRDSETYSDYKASKIIALGFGYLAYKFSKKLIRDPDDFLGD